MKFKSDREAAEYRELVAGSGRVSRLLLPIAALFESLSRELYGIEPVVTGVMRTAAEQAEIAKILRTPGSRSVHEFGRGVDFRSTIYTVSQRDELVARVNARFRYQAADGRLLKVLDYHSQGTGAHLHGQVPEGAIWVRSYS